MTLPRHRRRAFLRTLGLTAGSALFPSLLPRGARAAAAPKRFCVYYSYHGTLRQFWSPSGGSETSFELNSLMAPFAEFKKDLILIEGVDMLSRYVDPMPGNHNEGQNHALSAINAQDTALAGGITIDQAIAKGLGAQTPLPSLELGVNDSVNFPSYHYLSHSGPGQKLPTEADPRKAWARVFKDFVPPAAGVAPAGPDPAQVRQKSILDYVTNELAAVSGKMSADDKAKLAAHAQAVRDLEVRLLPTRSEGGPVASGCSGVPDGKLPAAGDLKGMFSQIADLQIRMIAMAFACDLTRVATLNVEELQGSAIPFIASGVSAVGATDAHDLAHKTSPENGLLRDSAPAVDLMRRYHLVYSDLFARLLKALAAIPDVDGRRVLDNTIVLWAGELATGNHEMHDLHWLLAGSGGGALTTGRWLKYPRTPNKDGGTNGPPHNNLLVSLANAMGVPMTTFGNPAICTGRLDRL